MIWILMLRGYRFCFWNAPTDLERGRTPLESLAQMFYATREIVSVTQISACEKVQYKAHRQFPTVQCEKT